MVNLIFLIIAATGLVLLYLQRKNNAEQEAWIKRESMELRQLQEQNRLFLATQLFYLRPENSLRAIPAPRPLLSEQCQPLFRGETAIRKRKIKAYHLF